MLRRLKTTVRAIARAVRNTFRRSSGDAASFDGPDTSRSLPRLRGAGTTLLVLTLVGAAGYGLYRNPPVQALAQGDVGLRTNQITGSLSEWRDGSVLVLPLLHSLRVVSLRDQTYRPEQIQRADGGAPLQSVEGLSFGVDLAIRYALDPTRLASSARSLPGDVTSEVIEPAVQGVIYKVFARYTVREAFSTKRAEIQQAIEDELKPRLAADGLLLRAVQIGKVDLPADYRRGMEHLLAEELATQKMRYTLELKDKRVKETELDAAAEKVRREVQAEAAAREQVIAARGQEEAMKHVLPFKQRQIEQRQLEAEAEKQARIRGAEGAAQARRIEAAGEADARQKLAEAEALRLERIGKVNAEQMAREGVLVSRHPLLIQKALADKLSDKVQVIIAPPSASGGFIGEALLGGTRQAAAPVQAKSAVQEEEDIVIETIASLAGAATLATAIITTDQAALRAAPRDSAQQQAVLRQGELVEVRGERMNYLQVYDHRRERAGFVRASQVRRTALTAAEAPELLAVLRFVKDGAGQEALGFALTAAWLQAAPAATVQGESGVEVLDALGVMAERLGSRASSGGPMTKASEQSLTAQLEVAGQYGVRFANYESDGRMQICYEGEAFRRVLAMPTAKAEQRARAALALTRPECTDSATGPLERAQLDQWRADVLDRVDEKALPGYMKNKILMRRASVRSALAYSRTRQAQMPSGAEAASASAAATRAIAALGGVEKAELTDEDFAAYNDAAMRVNASRWAAVDPGAVVAQPAKRPSLAITAGQPGETCVSLLGADRDATHPLVRRCTFSVVWPQSLSINREGTALAVAVQPMSAWRELWLFTQQGGAWTIRVVPPAASTPQTGYAEFAGWVPGGKQILVAREARGDGKYLRNFMVADIATLVPERQSDDPTVLGAFQRWQDAGWVRQSVSLR